jgi:hypothetical protein
MSRNKRLFVENTIAFDAELHPLAVLALSMKVMPVHFPKQAVFKKHIKGAKIRRSI